jgi:hypothetical protein
MQDCAVDKPLVQHNGQFPLPVPHQAVALGQFLRQAKTGTGYFGKQLFVSHPYSQIKKPASALPAGFFASKQNQATNYAPMATRLKSDTVMPFDSLSSSWAMVSELSFTNSWFNRVFSL